MKIATILIIILIIIISIIAPLTRGDDVIEMGGWLILIPFCFILLGYFSKSMKTGFLVGLSIYIFMIVGYWDNVVEYGFWDSLFDDGAAFYPLGYMILSTLSTVYSSMRIKGKRFDDKTRIY
ncbi:MAG: hypothetical protein PVF58_05220 [Candidatus Methanofastidiosia archaeon]